MLHSTPLHEERKLCEDGCWGTTYLSKVSQQWLDHCLDYCRRSHPVPNPLARFIDWMKNR
jgi:hypothetical protein